MVSFNSPSKTRDSVVSGIGVGKSVALAETHRPRHSIRPIVIRRASRRKFLYNENIGLAFVAAVVGSLQTYDRLLTGERALGCMTMFWAE